MKKNEKTVAIVGAVIVGIVAVYALTPKKCHQVVTKTIDGVQTTDYDCRWKWSCTPHPPWNNGWVPPPAGAQC